MAEPALAYNRSASRRVVGMGAVGARASAVAVASGEARRAPERVPSSRPAATPDLTVLPRTRREPVKAVLPMSVKATLLVAVFILASIPFIRIWLANDTMRMLVSSRSLEQQVSSYRAEGHRLESRYSAMTNPQTIQHLASELGMLPDSNPTYMRLADSVDQLAWDPAGSADATASRSAIDAFSWAVSYIFERVAEQQSSP